uniref:Uncharacterized protein n=1 Tax=Arundo donax TaxID=35708 RepID=A0A0A9ENF6_ARUDO
MIQLDVDIEALESSLSKLDSEGLNHFEESPIVGLSDWTDSCRSQSIVDKDYTYEVLQLDYQIRKSEMDLKLLQNLQRVEAMCQLESMLLPSLGKVLDFKDNCLRVFLKASILTSDCVVYGQKMDCVVDQLISDHELLIEVDENMEPKKVQIFPYDVCVDILIARLKSSREVISSPTMGWLILQFQHHIIVNALRQSLVNDANNSRHSFEYFDKEETVVAHLVRGVDVVIKTSADWPVSSYGLKLITICNSGTHPTNICSSLLSKTKELANGLELQIRRHLVRLVDAVEDILVRELQSELHSRSSSG